MAPPAYLERCPKCGEFRNERRKVLCLCDGIPCSRCKKNRIHRPISERYDERTGKTWHIPYFGYMLGCERCKAREYVGAFGLGDALGEQDDPMFWAAALERCWPPPHELWGTKRGDRPRFGVGEEPDPEGADQRTGLVETGSWWLDLSDHRRPRAEEGGRGLLPADGSRPVLWLSVVRPSRDRDRALVFSGETWGRLTDGEGTVRVWRRRVVNPLARPGEGGVRWEPTDEIVLAWAG